MEFRQIQYFLEVAKREHVTEAANALHVAQSSVSRQIFNLEEELGIELFIREGRNVKLTTIGKIFYDRMHLVMNMMDEAKREVKEYLSPDKGTVRIAFPMSMAAHTIPTIIHSFRMRYPEVKFQMISAAHKDLVKGVQKGDYNLAMVAPMPKNRGGKIKGTALFVEKIVALLPSHHPLAERDSIMLRELMDDSFVVLSESFVFRDQVIQACNNAGFSPKIAFEGEDIHALKGLVSASLGVALIPEMTLIDNTPRPTVMIPISDANLTRTVGVIYSNERKLSPTEEVFYQFLLETFERLNDFKN
ncbi:LysR family transcriptional regulator [Oceanobacillus caeni]|uniref:LysR family transcriptional regulator n=1 Tax=Oceanobacillus caeni TaxID=405946 RepID=UPI0036292D15